MRAIRKGIAIVAALGGIVVIGALIAGVFFASTQESQISGGTLVNERAFRAAELGLNTTLANWDNSGMYAMPTGGMDTMTYSGTGWVDTVVVTKITQNAFSLLSTATAGTGRLARSRKQTLLTVRLSTPAFNFRGALTGRGPMAIGGNSFIDGEDSNPPGWASCPLATSIIPGVAHSDTSTIKWNGDNCADYACVVGDPKVELDPIAGHDSTYFEYGDEDWTSLTASATKVIAGGTLSKIEPTIASGACDVTDMLNWGEPDHTNVTTIPCQSYFPIVYSTGNLHITGRRGQGILLVDGDLHLSGGFEFFGPIIVRGKLSVTGTGAKLNGAIMAANVDLDETKITGNATMNYSSCAIDKALGGSASPRRIMERAWTEVH